MYKRKRDERGRVIKYKARLTPQGCFQVFGLDFGDTYAPVARMTSVRYTLALSVLLSLGISGVDFTNAFLNAPLDHEVYVEAAPGQQPLPQGMVYRLQRALYGLKQSPREWNATLHTFMTEKCGYRQLQSEHCLYIKMDIATGLYVLVCVYVDDLIIAYSDLAVYESLLTTIESTFKITHCTELKKTLGFQIEYTADGGVFMHQDVYISDVLKCFGMTNCRSVPTPADHHIRLCKSGSFVARPTRDAQSQPSMGEGRDETKSSEDAA